MLTKTWNSDQARFDVLFDLPSELDIDHAAVVGDFNDWDPAADPMAKDADGRWVVTLSLEPGTAYRFRYHLGDDRWENDWSADDYAGNEFGGSDSVVQVPDAPTEPPAVKRATGEKAPARKAAKKRVAEKAGATKKAAATKKKAPARKAAAKDAPKKAGSE